MFNKLECLLLQTLFIETQFLTKLESNPMAMAASVNDIFWAINVELSFPKRPDCKNYCSGGDFDIFFACVLKKG